MTRSATTTGPFVADPGGPASARVEEDNRRFREDIAGLRFSFRCEDCAHYGPAARRCSLEFDPRFLTTTELRAVADDGHVVFCKYFESD
jgi:hypothetical protein